LANELLAFNSVDTANFLHFYGAYFDEGSVKIVLEYMDCGTLRSFIDFLNLQNERMPENIIS